MKKKNAKGNKTGRSNSIIGRSIITPLMSVAFMAMLLTIVVLWHGGRKPTPTTFIARTKSNRFLVNINEDSPTLDDDNTRSGICKRYLMNFLNGTTDARDQCQAFYNAYRVADCVHETHADIFGVAITEDKNSSTTDDVGIDDFFEHWECCDSIKAYYNNNCEHDSGVHSLQLLGVMLVFLFCTMVKAVLKSWNINWLPDACAFILVGTLVGGMLRLLNSNLVPKLSFDNDLFLQIMLPPIIFEAALSYHLPKIVQ